MTGGAPRLERSPSRFAPVWLDYPTTFFPAVSLGAQLWQTANHAFYLRLLTGGTISKVGLHVGVSSGNISVAAYQNSGAGRSAVPGTRLATSGAVACPTAGFAEVALGSSVTVEAGDWLALSCDNTTASFHGVSGSASEMVRGHQMVQGTAHPLPASPSSLVPTTFRCPVLIGIA